VVERTFAHLCETGGSRRVTVRGMDKVKIWYPLRAASHNLGLILRMLVGTGKPRSFSAALLALWTVGFALRTALWKHPGCDPRPPHPSETRNSSPNDNRLARQTQTRPTTPRRQTHRFFNRLLRELHRLSSFLRKSFLLSKFSSLEKSRDDAVANRVLTTLA